MSLCENFLQMSTLNTSLSIGVYGGVWAQTTVDFFKTIGLFADGVSLFEYTHREALSFDQYDIFIITDFGKPAQVGWNDNDGYWLKRLNEMREIIWSRSMKSIIFANHDDPEVFKSLRDACTGVVEVETLLKKNKFSDASIIPQSFALAVLTHCYMKKKQEIVNEPLIFLEEFQEASVA